MQQHPLIGTELLAGVPMLEGEGLQVVRSHHERWEERLPRRPTRRGDPYRSRGSSPSPTRSMR